MPAPTFVGITASPNNFYDEGIGYALDLMQETAGVNALAVYTHQRMSPAARRPDCLADHGKPYDKTRDSDPATWVRVHDEHYGGTMLRHIPQGDRDILADLEAPARDRGIRVYARILEGWQMGVRPNFEKVAQLDTQGRIARRPCYRHPDYVNFYLGTATDLCKTYPWIAGIYWGSEAGSPLTEAFAGEPATCFCAHCRAAAREAGIDPERARQGFLRLAALASQTRDGQRPRDGAFIAFLRLFMEYPELLGWERLWAAGYYAIPRAIQGLIKTLDPALELGCHADHQIAGLSPFRRAALDYADMAEFYDWIKPCAYRLVTGPRLLHHATRLHQTALADLSRDAALSLLHAINGLDPAGEPTWDDLASGDLTRLGMSADYTRREVARCVEAVRGRARVYAGVAFGIPIHNGPAPEPAEATHRDCLAAFEAGADGLLLSREYDEMDLDNLRAVGRAVREHAAATPAPVA